MRLKHARVVTLEGILDNHTIEIDGGRIRALYPSKEEHGVNLEGAYVMAGFIDTHIHGASGADVMDATPEALETISKALLQEGTTRFLPTTMTMDEKSICDALKNIAQARVSGALIEGVHLEGPFISPKYPGAQNPAFITQGTIELFDRYFAASRQRIKVMTFAPERHDAAFILHVQAKGVALSMGHTAANEEEFSNAYDLGVRRLTHFYNAMSPLHHRDLGVVGMSLLEDDMVYEVIADRIHSSDHALKLIATLKPQQITFISDSISAKNLPDGNYTLGGLAIEVKRGVARTQSGALAGSTLHLDQALRNMAVLTQWSLSELSRALSYQPAKLIKRSDELGQIKPGYLADLVVLNEQLDVQKVFVEGNLKFDLKTA